MTIKSKIIELANSYSKTLQEKIAGRMILKCKRIINKRLLYL